MPSLGSPVASSHSALILRHLINEAKFLWVVLGHSCNEFSTKSLISLGSNAFESFASDTSSEEFVIDSSVVDRDETIGLEKMGQFIKEMVRIVVNELAEVMNVVVVKCANGVVNLSGILNIARRSVKLEGSEERAS